MIEVLKQALDALETEVSIDWTNNDEFNASAEKMHDAIASLHQAIAELESQNNNPIKDGWKLSIANGHSGYGVYVHMEEYPEDGAFLLLPIKELESQEPVGEVDAIGLNDTDFHVSFKKPMPLGTKLYTHPPQRTEQEPVQVSPLEFVEMVMEKEHLIGKPIFWAEWPNKEKNT